MRAAFMALFIAILAVVGLYIVGMTVRPETRTLEQDAVGAADA